MRVICTNPTFEEFGGQVKRPHENDIPDEVMQKGSSVPQFYCQDCGMPLVLESRYIATKVLGQGGFGVTFCAWSRYAQKNVVIKRLLPKKNLPPHIVQKINELFAQEGEVLEKLNYDGIPNLRDHFIQIIPDRSSENQESEAYYLVQELVNGKDLQKEFENDGKFSEKKILKILEDVLPILSYIHGDKKKHKKKVIHRDIKPSNIVRSNSGDLYLIDFGSVKQIVQEGVPSDQTALTALNQNDVSDQPTGIGTPNFAPDSQLRPKEGDKPETWWDLYGLAATCIYLMTGRRVKDELGIPQNLHKWKEEAKPSLKLGKILDRMLESDSKKRYKSADEVIKDLFPIKPSLRWLLPIGGLILSSTVLAALAIIFEESSMPIPDENLHLLFNRGERSFLRVPSECTVQRQRIGEATDTFNEALLNNNSNLFGEAAEAFLEASKPVGGDDCVANPEALIASGNAKALQRSSEIGSPPLTIAVVAPGVPSQMRDKLYGVAQAQYAFNESQNENSPLLQVIIVRDDASAGGQGVGSTATTSNGDVAKQVAQNLVENKIPTEGGFTDVDILGVIGHYTSDATLAASNIYKDKLPSISSTSTAVREYQDGIFSFIGRINQESKPFNLNPWHLRTSPDDAIAAAQVVESFKDELESNFQAYIVFASNSRYSVSAAKAFEDELRAKGGEINENSRCDITRDGARLLNEFCPPIGNSQVIVFVPSTERLGQVTETIKDGQWDLSNKILMGGDAMYDGRVRGIGRNILGMRLGVAWHRDLLEDNSNLRNDLLSLWGTTFLQWGTATTYDATQALIQAIEIASKNGQPTREKVRDALISNDFEADGFMDPVRFNRSTGDRNLENTGVGVVVEIKQADGTTCTGPGLQYCLVQEDN